MDLSKLKTPFPVHKIHWRVGATTADKSKGIALAYIDARDVMGRLDEVCGPENWQCRYPFVGCCEVGIKVDGEWIWKANGAGVTDYEAEKGQYSDAFKRAAVLWGIGQYLYDLPNEWVPIIQKGKSYVINGKPKLPDWATPNPTVKITKDQKKKVFDHSIDYLAAGDAHGLTELWDEWEQEEKIVLWNMFNSQQRSAMTALMKELKNG